MELKIGTFNAENLFFRYEFRKNVDPTDFVQKGGTINMLGYEILDEGQREHTAKVITANDPDVLALQEVENFLALRQFAYKYLKKKYPYSILIDGNDPRQIDVCILSKYPIGNINTHIFDKGEHGKIFSRDCLEADILGEDGEPLLTLFVNHLKSKLPSPKTSALTSDQKREIQAARVAEIIESRFGKGVKDAKFAVLGDFNDAPKSKPLKPLLGKPWVENVIERLDKAEQWTHYYRSEVNQFDYILLSKALGEANPKALPTIERRGLADYVKAYTGKRFPGVGPEGTEASDHCAVFVKLKV